MKQDNNDLLLNATRGRQSNTIRGKIPTSWKLWITAFGATRLRWGLCDSKDMLRVWGWCLRHRQYGPKRKVQFFLLNFKPLSCNTVIFFNHPNSTAHHPSPTEAALYFFWNVLWNEARPNDDESAKVSALRVYCYLVVNILETNGGEHMQLIKHCGWVSETSALLGSPNSGHSLILPDHDEGELVHWLSLSSWG